MGRLAGCGCVKTVQCGWQWVGVGDARLGDLPRKSLGGLGSFGDAALFRDRHAHPLVRRVAVVNDGAVDRPSEGLGSQILLYHLTLEL